MRWRAERERQNAEAEDLAREHEKLRAQLLVTVAKTERYAHDLLVEVERWHERTAPQ